MADLPSHSLMRRSIFLAAIFCLSSTIGY